MSRCGGCGVRLGRASAFCPGCGAAAGSSRVATLTVELDGPADAAPTGSGGGELRFDRPRPGRTGLVAGAVALAAAAVVASVALGGGPDASSPSTTSPTTSPSATATTAIATASTASTAISTASTTPDTTSGPTTTEAPARLLIGQGPLAGEPTGLAVLAALNGNPYLIDLDTTVMTEVPASFPLVDVRLSPVGLVYQGNGGGLFVLAPGAERPTTVADAGGNYLGDDRQGRAWFQSYGNGFGLPRLVHIDAPGAAPVELERGGGSWLGLPDGAGGLVTTAGGVVFRTSADGAVTSLGPAELADANRGHVLLRVCDQPTLCRYDTVDLATGVRRTGPRTEPLLAEDGAVLSPDGGWWVGMERAIDRPGEGRLWVGGLDGSRLVLGASFDGCPSRWCPGAPTWGQASDGTPWLTWVVDQRTIGLWRPGLTARRTFTLPDGPIDGVLRGLVSVSMATRDVAYAVTGVRG